MAEFESACQRLLSHLQLQSTLPCCSACCWVFFLNPLRHSCAGLECVGRFQTQCVLRELFTVWWSRSHLNSFSPPVVRMHAWGKLNAHLCLFLILTGSCHACKVSLLCILDLSVYCLATCAAGGGCRRHLLLWPDHWPWLYLESLSQIFLVPSFPLFYCKATLDHIDYFVPLWSKVDLKLLNFIQKAHSLTVGGFLLHFVLVWNMASVKLNSQFHSQTMHPLRFRTWLLEQCQRKIYENQKKISVVCVCIIFI